MSASVIEALPHPVPITNGKAVIGLLSPVRKTDSETIAKVVKEAQAEFEQLSPEMQARIERFLADSDG
ncbi:hypothetical protein [Bosea sp. (in: a-proteobacteria)]|uniref:hypothetical protein n=1 Tax=Bosea sp. (in: a-proteobacteria) TaxID=1871050 RepID=UPI0035640D09